MGRGGHDDQRGGGLRGGRGLHVLIVPQARQRPRRKQRPSADDYQRPKGGHSPG